MPQFELPAALEQAYGGPFGFHGPRVVANFVTSVDGIVALSERGESGHVISADSEADRFVMALLRSCVHAILIGAGTLRSDPGHLWTPESIYPKGAALFEENRRRLGLAARPTLVVMTASGGIDPSHPALSEAVVVTTRAGSSALGNRLPSTTRLVALDATGNFGPIQKNIPAGTPARNPGAPDMTVVMTWLRAQGLTTVLTEGGPQLFGDLLANRLVDELFLTVSPTLFGRYANDARKSLVDGRDLGGSRVGLLSVRRHGSHLFLRYSLAPASAEG